MKIAVEGCCHGSLDATYSTIAQLERRNGYRVDLLLIGGDFQAIRNHADLTCMAVPQKFRQLGEFHKYYTGAARAPILTIVIGGNHEASNYLWELYHGGWLAPNIYYLGGAGCVNVNGVRIAGASGIYNSAHYHMGHFERVPYDNGPLRSIYHIRRYDVTKLAQLSPPDIFLSHDWPQGIEHHGDLQTLLRRKPFFKADIDKGELGSPPMTELLKKLRPKRWFSAHLHVKFEATFSHLQSQPTSGSAPAAIEANPDEIAIDDFDEFDDDPTTTTEVTDPLPTSPDPLQATGASETLFLALDKCLPRRQYLEVVDIPTLNDSNSVNLEVSSANITDPSQSGSPEPEKILTSSSAEPSTTDMNPPNPEEALIEGNSEALMQLDQDPEANENAELKAAFLPTAFGKQKQPKPKSLPPKPQALPPKPQAQSPLPQQPRSAPVFTYDIEWLAISRALHPFLSLERKEIPLPSENELRDLVAQELVWVKEHVGAGKKVEDVQTFVMTAPGPTGAGQGNQRVPQNNCLLTRMSDGWKHYLRQ